MFELVRQHPCPVITRESAGAEQNKYGFEGGRCLKLGSIYHLFVSEMAGDPHFAKTRLAHWTSADRVQWQRQSTLYESSGEFEGKDPRAAIYLPQPVYDESAGRWNLFYAAFRSAPNVPGKWLLNHDGQIWRAVSRTPGLDGIGGPYEDAGVVLRPGGESDPWEGLQGTDSFFPYRVGEAWFAFYGSAHTHKWPCDFWGVGLASAPSLAGPWKRCSSLNPVLFDRPFIENPIVTQLPDGTYAAVYDAELKGKVIGCTTSPDGIHWSPGYHLSLDAIDWLVYARTPLSLIPAEEPDTFDVLFTGLDRANYRSVGWVTLRRLQKSRGKSPCIRAACSE